MCDNQNSIDPKELNILQLDPPDRIVLKIADERDAIQKKTFTKWVNKHLKKEGKKINQIYEDLRDGENLLSLLEVLSKTKLPREKGCLRFHMLQNVQIALDFLRYRSIKLVNIRSEDIVDGNPKLTLGLIWTIILHFQISDIIANGAHQDANSAREALLSWVQINLKPYNRIKVKDFTESWKDGLAFNYILHRFRPECVNLKKVLRLTPRERLKLAFDTAKKEFAVTKLLDPEDVDIEKPDERSLITYVSSFYDAMPEKPAFATSQLENEMTMKLSEYESRVSTFMAWIKESQQFCTDYDVKVDRKSIQDALRELELFVKNHKGPREQEKSELYANYEDLQEFGATFYDKSKWDQVFDNASNPMDIENAWDRLMTSLAKKHENLLYLNDNLEALNRTCAELNSDYGLCVDILTKLRSTQEVEIREALIRDAHSLMAKITKSIYYLKDKRVAGHKVWEKKCQNLSKQLEIAIRSQSPHDRKIDIAVIEENGAHDAEVDGQISSLETLVKQCRTWIDNKMRQIESFGKDIDIVELEDVLKLFKKDEESILAFDERLNHLAILQKKIQSSDSLPIKLSIVQEWFQDVSDKYKELREAYGRTSANLTVLQSFVNDSMDLLSWFNQKIDVEIRRDWASLRFDMDATQQYHKQLCGQLNEKKGVLDSVLNSGMELSSKNYSPTQIQCLVNSLQIQWMWLNQLVNCFDVHYENKQKYNEINTRLLDIEKAIYDILNALKTGSSSSNHNGNEINGDQPCSSFAHEEIRSSQNALSNGNGHHTEYASYSATTVQSNGVCGAVNGIHTRSDVLDYIEKIKKYGEELDGYADQLIDLKAQSNRLCSITARKYKTKEPRKVDALCDYKSNKDLIVRGDSYWLVDNQNITYWKVVDAKTNKEHSCPSVCFVVQPPAEDLERCIENLLAVIKKSHESWSICYRRIQYEAIMKTIETINQWDRQHDGENGHENMTPKAKGELMIKFKSLMRDFLTAENDGPIMSEEDIYNLQEEISKSSMLHMILSPDSEVELPIDDGEIKQQLSTLKSTLDEFDETLSKRHKMPLSLHHDDLENMVLVHKEYEENLQMIEPELENLKAKVKSLPPFMQTSPLTTDLDDTLKLWDTLWVKSHLYVEKLKCIEILSNNLEEATHILSKAEISLANFESSPAYTGTMTSSKAPMGGNKRFTSKAEHNELNSLRAYMDTHESLVNNLTYHMGILEKLYENPQDSQALHPLLDVQKSVQNIATKWDTLRSQIDDKSKGMIEQAYQQIANLNKEKPEIRLESIHSTAQCQSTIQDLKAYDDKVKSAISYHYSTLSGLNPDDVDDAGAGDKFKAMERDLKTSTATYEKLNAFCDILQAYESCVNKLSQREQLLQDYSIEAHKPLPSLDLRSLTSIQAKLQNLKNENSIENELAQLHRDLTEAGLPLDSQLLANISESLHKNEKINERLQQELKMIEGTKNSVEAYKNHAMDLKNFIENAKVEQLAINSDTLDRLDEKQQKTLFEKGLSLMEEGKNKMENMREASTAIQPLLEPSAIKSLDKEWEYAAQQLQEINKKMELARGKYQSFATSKKDYQHLMVDLGKCLDNVEIKMNNIKSSPVKSFSDVSDNLKKLKGLEEELTMKKFDLTKLADLKAKFQDMSPDNNLTCLQQRYHDIAGNLKTFKGNLGSTVTLCNKYKMAKDEIVALAAEKERINADSLMQPKIKTLFSTLSQHGINSAASTLESDLSRLKVMKKDLQRNGELDNIKYLGRELLEKYPGMVDLVNDDVKSIAETFKSLEKTCNGKLSLGESLVTQLREFDDLTKDMETHLYKGEKRLSDIMNKTNDQTVMNSQARDELFNEELANDIEKSTKDLQQVEHFISKSRPIINAIAANCAQLSSAQDPADSANQYENGLKDLLSLYEQRCSESLLNLDSCRKITQGFEEMAVVLKEKTGHINQNLEILKTNIDDATLLDGQLPEVIGEKIMELKTLKDKIKKVTSDISDLEKFTQDANLSNDAQVKNVRRLSKTKDRLGEVVEKRLKDYCEASDMLEKIEKSSDHLMDALEQGLACPALNIGEDEISSTSSYIDQAKLLDKHYQELKDFKRKTFEPLSDSVQAMTKTCTGKNPSSLNKIIDLLYEDLDDQDGNRQRQAVKSLIEPKILALNDKNDALAERIANTEAHLAARIQDNLEAEFLHNKIAPKMAKLRRDLNNCLSQQDPSGEIILNSELLFAGLSPRREDEDNQTKITTLNGLTKNMDDMIRGITAMEPVIKELDRDVSQLQNLSKSSALDTHQPLFEEIEAIKLNRADGLAHMNEAKKLLGQLNSYYNPISRWMASAEKASSDPNLVSNSQHLQELIRTGKELQQTTLPKLLDTGYALMPLLPASQTCPDFVKNLLAEVREGMETVGDRLEEACKKSTQNQHNFKDLEAKVDKISNWLEAVAAPKLEIYRYQLSPLLEPLQNQHRKLESLKNALDEKGDELDFLKRASQDLPSHSAESVACVQRLKDAEDHLEKLRDTCGSLCTTVGQELLPKAQNFHEIRKELNAFLSTMENNMDARELGSMNVNDQLEKLMTWTVAIQGKGAILDEMDEYLTTFPTVSNKGTGREGEIFQLLESLVRQDRSRFEALKSGVESRREKLQQASQLVTLVERQIDTMTEWMRDADLYLASDDPSASYKPDPGATKFGSPHASGDAKVDVGITDPSAQVTSILYLLDPDLLKSRLDNLKLLAADIQAQKVKLRSINMEALRAHREVAAYLIPNTIMPPSKETKASNQDVGNFEEEELMGEDEFPSLRLPAKVEALKRLTNNVAQSCDQKVGACRQLVPLLESFTSDYDAFVAWLDEAEHDTRNYGTLLVDLGQSPDSKHINLEALRNNLEGAERGILEHRDALKELNERADAIIKVSSAFAESRAGNKKREGLDENPIEKHLLELTQDLGKRYQCLADCLAQDKLGLEASFSPTHAPNHGNDPNKIMLALNRSDLPNTLEGVLMSVARTADQLAKTEPISCYPDKIRAQIAENQHFAQDMEGRAATYDAVKMAAENFIQSGQIGGLKVSDDVAEHEKREIEGKLEKLNQLWEAVVSTTHTRRKALEDTYEISSKFWEALFALFSALKEIQENVGYYETPSIAPQNIQEQQNDLLALKEELECVVGPEVEQCRQTGQDLLELIEENAQERPDVEKGMEELENAYETTRHAIVERGESLGEAMDRSMLLHDLLAGFLDWLDRAEQELAEVDAGVLAKNSLAAARSTDSLRSSCGDLLNSPAAAATAHSSRKGRELKRLHEQADCLRALRARFNGKTIELERINALGNEIMASRSGSTGYETEPDASALSHNLHEANERWECVMEALSDRQQALETSLLELGQLRGAVEELCAWLDQTEATLGREANETTRSISASGSANMLGEKRLTALSDVSLIKTIEHRMAKHKMLRNEVTSRKSTVDSLNHAVSRLQTASMALSSVSLLASNTETDELAGAVAVINERWRTLLGAMDAHTQRLENELKRARSFVSELQDATAWLNEIDSQHLLTAKPLAGLPETTREQMDQFELVYSELESGKPVIEELLARGQREREKDGADDGPLDRQLEILKHKWENIRVRAQDRKTKLEIAHKQAKEFQECYELCGLKLGELEAVLNRDCDQSLPRRLEGIQLRVQEHANSFVALAETYKADHGIRLEKSGTHLKYFCQKQDAIVIKNMLIQAQHRWEKVVARGAERRRALEKALAETHEFYDAHDHLTQRLTGLQHELDSIFSTRDDESDTKELTSCVDKQEKDAIEPSSTYLKSKERLKQLKEFRQALSTIQPEYEWLLQKGKDLKDKCNTSQPDGQADANGLQSMLNELKQKWNALIVESSNHQKVLEGDLILCGQIHEALQELREWLSAEHDRLAEESKEGTLGDIDTILGLIERHQIFQKELDSRTANIDSLKAAVAKFVDDEGSNAQAKDQQAPNRMMENVKQPLQDLVSLWSEVCALSQAKDGKLASAKEKAEIFHASVRILADWMEAVGPRVRDIDQAGDVLLTSTTADCGARTLASRLELCKVIKAEIAERKATYNQTLEMGQEIVADAYVTALKPMENWLGFLKEMWEDLNGGVEHLHHRLEREYEDAKLNAKLLEELLAWLTTAEATITAADQRVLPRDIETIEQYLLEHKEFMDNMSNKQQDVQKLTSNNSIVPLSLPEPKFKRSKFQSHKKSQSDLTAEAQALQSQNEPKNPKIRMLLQKWRCVWLLAIDRQGKLVDYLNYLKEVERLKDFEFEEWRKRYMSWMNHNKSRVMDFFRSQDKDGDGRIPVQDFIEGILATRFQTSRPEMEHVAAVFDANSDGFIDYKEYVAALKAPAKDDGLHPKTDVEKVKDEVQRQANLCECNSKYKVDHIGENKYRFGDSQKLRLVRILRSTVMVRVGGGWVALEEFLVKNDPCRAKGRTNIELREPFILAPGVSQAMAPFKSKSPSSAPQTPASFLSSLGLSSSTGPITKIREKTPRTTPWRINSSTSHTPERRKTPSTPSTPPYQYSAYYDSANASRIPRKTSDGTGSRASSKSGSKAPSRIGSRPQSPAPVLANLSTTYRSHTPTAHIVSSGYGQLTPTPKHQSPGTCEVLENGAKISLGSANCVKGKAGKTQNTPTTPSTFSSSKKRIPSTTPATSK